MAKFFKDNNVFFTPGLTIKRTQPLIRKKRIKRKYFKRAEKLE